MRPPFCVGWAVNDHNLDSKGGLYRVPFIEAIKRDTRSSDYSSNRACQAFSQGFCVFLEGSQVFSFCSTQRPPDRSCVHMVKHTFG